MEEYEYISNLKKLLEKEYLEEKKQTELEIKNNPASKRERRGRALTSMIRQESAKLERENIYRFVKKNKSKFEHTELSIGDCVILCRTDEKRVIDSGIIGEVVSKGEQFIDVKLNKLSNFIKREVIDIHKYTNETTYKIQKEVITKIKDWPDKKNKMRNILLGESKPRTIVENEPDYYFKDLNPSQKIAVKNSVFEQDMYLIQGPPGTGKTKTAVEIIRQHLKKKCKILVCADSNIAVDNIMEGCLDFCSVVRMGNSPKMLENIQKHSFMEVMKRYREYKDYELNLDNIKRFRMRQSEQTFPSKQLRKNMSDLQIVKNAERGQGMFGVDAKTMKSMAKWIESQMMIKRYMSEADKIKKKLEAKIIEDADVIFSTNTSAHHIDCKFDIAIIDEAGQSTEISCLIPISKSKKVILIGDHKQLPPTVMSKEAKELSISLFERMIGKVRSVLLDTSYRMVQQITEYPSNEFYNGQLCSAVKFDESYYNNFKYKSPIVFIDVDSKEEKYKDQVSLYNKKEQEVIFDLVLSYPKEKLRGESFGIISPYLEQVKQLRKQFVGFKINTVDGFQGREKEIIIISLVRANNKGEIGFLKDYRRLNVALTRAKKQVVIVGNSKTIKDEKLYKDLIEFVKEKGEYVKL